LNCASCKRWWRHVFTGKDGKSHCGTCWLDGSKTHKNYGCGFHSDLHPLTQREYEEREVTLENIFGVALEKKKKSK